MQQTSETMTGKEKVIKEVDEYIYQANPILLWLQEKLETDTGKFNSEGEGKAKKFSFHYELSGVYFGLAPVSVLVAAITMTESVVWLGLGYLKMKKLTKKWKR